MLTHGVNISSIYDMITQISPFVMLSFRKEALACYFDLILLPFLSNINLMNGLNKVEKIS